MNGSGAAAGLVVVLVEPLDPFVRSLLGRELDGMARVLSQWGHFRRPVRVATVHSQTELRAAAACPTDLQLHAIASLDGLLLLAPQAWSLPPASHAFEQVVLHELAHVLMFQRCAPVDATTAAYLPTWFREGMATVVAGGAPHPALRRSLADHPALDTLPTATDKQMTDDPDACYTAAALAFQTWMERFGNRKLSALCQAMRNGHRFGPAHERACGETEEAFLRDWVQSVRLEGRTV
jgi:hypothetical protein